MDPLYAAHFAHTTGNHQDAIQKCTDLLKHNPYDQAVWYLKARAIAASAYVDELDFEDESAADALLDDNATAAMPRPGTSLSRPVGTAAAGGGGAPLAGLRPVSASGRPITGFARPGTGSARVDPRQGLAGALAGSAKPGGAASSRPLTALGRLVRLGTASMAAQSAAEGGAFIDVDRLDLRKYAQRPALSKALCDYIIYHDHNPRKALELAASATQVARFEDWWWKERLGKCYYMLGMYREAEKQFVSSLKSQPSVAAYLQLANVALRLDQPKKAIEVYEEGQARFPSDVSLVVGVARVQDALGEEADAAATYRRVLAMDPSNVEAIACLAASHFYSDQPELALRFYRRLLQMGVQNTEVWNNLGLCCFYAAQYDMALSCFEKALSLADDAAMADVWYNLGHVAIGIGDLGLGYQAFKVALSIDPDHAEACSNLGVLELRKGHVDAARTNFRSVHQSAPHMFEPLFNGALLAFKLGEFQEAFELVTRAIAANPHHADSKELRKQLTQHFALL